MSWVLIITLILLGFLLFLVEILLIPGTSVAGIIALVSMVIGIVGAFGISTSAGLITLFISLALGGGLIYFALKSKTWKKFALDAAVDGRVNLLDENKLKVGDQGITVSRIAPMGKAEFHGEFFEVVSDAGLIDEQKKVVVKKIDGNKIWVILA